MKKSQEESELQSCSTHQSGACASAPNHRADLSRLRRISGQLSGIERMIEEGRYCPDILVQTRAVSAAIRSLETSLLERHINHCVQAAFVSDDEAEREAKVSELIEIFSKRLDR